MNERLIRDALEERALREVPTDKDLWPAIRARITTDEQSAGQNAQPVRQAWTPRATTLGNGNGRSRTTNSPLQERSRRSRLNFSMAGMVALLVIAVGLAAFMLGTRVGQPDEGPVAGVPTETVVPTPPVEEYNGNWESQELAHIRSLATDINTSHTIGAYTVTLLAAYADVNQTIVFYKVEGPETAFFSASQGKLTKPDGTTLGPSTAHMPLGDPLKTGEAAMIFDTPSLGQLPSRFDLTLSLTLIKGRFDEMPPANLNDINAEATAAARTAMATVEAKITASPNTQFNEVNWPYLNEGEEIVAGAFEFSFAVPLTTKGIRIAEINQTVNVAGINVTLERVVVTPGETRMYLRYVDQREDKQGSLSLSTIHLVAGDFNSATDNAYSVGMSMSGSGDTAEAQFSLGTDLTGKQGEWTLTIPEFESRNRSGMRGGYRSPPHIGERARTLGLQVHRTPSTRVTSFFPPPTGDLAGRCQSPYSSDERRFCPSSPDCRLLSPIVQRA